MVTYADIISSASPSSTPAPPARTRSQSLSRSATCAADGSSPPVIRRQLSLLLKRQPSGAPKPTIMRFASTASNSRRWQRSKQSGDLKDPEGTVLRALPRPDQDEPTPQSPPAASETTPVPNDEIVSSILKSHPAAIDAMGSHSIPQYSPSTPKNPSPKRRPSKKDRKAEITSPIIGVYRDGKIHWRSQTKSDGQIPFVSSASQAFYQSSRTPSLSEHRSKSLSPSVKRLNRPKIEVIIPSDQQRNEFTRGPALRSARSAPGLSAGSESGSSFEVSPASAHTNSHRNSFVSPIVPPHRAAKPRRPFNKRAPTTLYECEDEEDDFPIAPVTTNPNSSKAAPETGNSVSSTESKDANREPTSAGTGSSVYSDENSSMSSLEPEPLTKPKPSLPELRNSVTRMFSLDSPITFATPKHLDPETKSNFAPEVVSAPVLDDSRPPTPPPKPQVIQIALEFPPNGRIRSGSQSEVTRGSPNAKRISVRASRPSKRRSTLPKDTRFEGRQMKPSPTLSEVERELHEQLMSTTSEHPFRWDQIRLPEGSDTGSPLKKTTSETGSKQQSSPASDHSSAAGRVAVSTSHIASQALTAVKLRSLSASNSPPSNTSSSPAELPGDSPTDRQGRGLAIELPAELTVAELPTMRTPRDERRRSRLEELQKSVGKLIIPETRNNPVTEIIPAPRCEAEKQLQEGPTPEQAEEIVVLIFESLDTLDDLFNTALISNAFYGAFKRHELELMRKTLYKMSPPAWERREMTVPQNEDDGTPDSSQPLPEYDAVTYYAHYNRDLQVISQLKQLILARCNNFLRAETREALQSEDMEVYARVDNAFWRIWTFCRLFGGGRGREQDVVGQIDWLKGGLVANQQTLSSTVITRDSLALSDVLLMAPEGFGLGNPGGLSAEQLYDMMELWTCLGVLIQSLEGRTEQARQYGVYEATEVGGGDIEGEERMLEEWYYYILTLGLDAIVEIADDVVSEESTAFEKAQRKGWMKWTPPPEKHTRANFLKDAVSRVYEEKISNTLAINAPQREEMRDITRERIQGHAAEIKLRKRAGDLKLIRMSQERPMSDWTNVMQVLDANGEPAFPLSPRSAGYGSRSHSRRNSSLSDADNGTNAGGTATFREERIVEEEEPNSAQEHETVRSVQHTRFESSSSIASSAPAGSFDPSSVHPLLRANATSTEMPRERRPSEHSRNSSHSADHQHPRQYSMDDESDPAENTADKAIFRIVEMGFTAEEAKHALRVTDMGDGLRLDRAVELLLRRYEG
jgi:hypothetical protein